MKFGLLSVCCLIVSLVAGTSGVAFAQEGMEGRWLLTETVDERDFASWLRVTRQPGLHWKALYLHRGGHPLPANVTVDGNRIQVQVVPESHYSGRQDVRWPALTGTLEDDKLTGTGTDRRGNTFSWVAERAPERLEGSDRKVEWGEPIKLISPDLSGWETLGTRESQWVFENGLMVNQATGANIRTTEEFRDFRLHVEFRIPEGSNSGIYLRGRYETQVADDYGKEPYTRMVGGIYGQIAPVINATMPAGEWNVLDVTLIGYRVTIHLNGQTTVDGQLIGGITGGALNSDERAPGPIMLQGDHGPVQYRNIVLTPALPAEKEETPEESETEAPPAPSETRQR